MGAPHPAVGQRDTLETVFRKHIAEMRKYANELEPALGADSPIVRRIRSCAMGCSDVLDKLAKRAASGIDAATAGETGNTDSTEGESAVPLAGDAQKASPND